MGSSVSSNRCLERFVVSHFSKDVCMIKNKDCNSTILVANLRRSGTKGNELVWSGAESTFAHTVAIKKPSRWLYA